MHKDKENFGSRHASQHGSRQGPSAGNQFEAQIERLMTVTGAKNKEHLAKLLGRSSAAIRAWKKDGRIPGIWVNKICDKYNISADWLIYGLEPMDRNDVFREVGGEYKVIPRIPEVNGLTPESFILIPYVEAYLGAGDGSFIEPESRIELYAFRKDWISKVSSSWKNLILMPVRGPSMEKTIFDGDVVMIDTGKKRILRDLIYAVRILETITIKRIQRLPNGKIRLISDNSQFPPQEFHPDEIQILGRIIWLARDHFH